MLKIPSFDFLRMVTVRSCSLSLTVQLYTPFLSEVEGSKVEPPRAGSCPYNNHSCRNHIIGGVMKIGINYLNRSIFLDSVNSPDFSR